MMEWMYEISYKNLIKQRKPMNQIKKIVVGICLLLVSDCLLAQRNVLRYADIEYDLKRFEHAGTQYAEAYGLKQTYYSARRAAESYSYLRSYEKAFEWWEKTVAFEESEREDYLNYARAAVQAGEKLSDLSIVLSEKEREQVYGGVSVREDDTIEFRSLDRINSPGTDYGLSQDVEGRTYFVSDRDLSGQTLKKPIRFDVRKRFSGEDRYRLNDRGFHQIFKEEGDELQEVLTDLEGVYHLSMPAFYQRGEDQEVVFTAVLRDDQGRRRRRHEVHAGLYIGLVQENGSFGAVRALPFNDLSEYSVMHGFVYNDRLYFSSDMSGGYGGFDLYYADMEGGSYGSAINMGPKVNGPEDEVFPYLHQGELYFSSDRSVGLGGLDIYRIDSELVGMVENMGRPYNTAQDDFAYFVDEEGMEYLSSDRGMSESRDDIYYLASLLDRYRFRVRAESGERLDGMEDLELKVISADDGEIPMEIEDGRIAALKQGDYTVEIRKKGYFPARVPLSALAPDGKEKVIDYKLVPIPYGRLLAIDTVYYDLDKFNIRPDAAEVLDRVSALLESYPEFNLNITSHTDSRASNAYNELLSEDRSRSAASYLQGSGVSSDRLSTDWKGEKQPANPCVDEVDCPELMHEKNRRSILSLELYPDKGVDYALPGGLENVGSTEELMEAIKRMVREKASSMMPLVLGEEMLYYDLDSYTIRADASKVLKDAEVLLKKYPFLKLEIISYTDSRQTAQYNERLSKNRSMAVFFHLRNRQIGSDRMQIRWYGESNPENDCRSGMPCSEEEHQQNRRSELKLTVAPEDLAKVPAAWKSGKRNFRELLGN